MKRMLMLVNGAVLLVMFGLIALLLASTLPSALGYESVVVTSSAMQPALARGDLAVVAPVPAEQLSIGDIIFYRTPSDPDAVVVSRLKGIELEPTGRLSLQTTTEGSPSVEPVSVAARNPLARVVYVIPRLGVLIDFVARPAGKGLMLGVPVLLLVLDTARKRLYKAQPRDPAQRVVALLGIGHRALSAGHPQLAIRAADGVLELSPGNAAAWHLKALALAALKVDLEHVAA